jgi:C-terminal processing protease CtpA/Prc
MKRQIATWMILAVLLMAPASSTAVAGEYKCTAPTQECLDKMTANLMKRGWLGIFGNEIRENGTMYMEIIEVVPGSPAESADIRPGDVLVAINGVDLVESNKEKLYKIQMKNRPGVEFRYTLKRGRHRVYKRARLESMPYEVIVRAVGAHMLEHSTVDIAGLLKEEERKGKKK